MTLAERFTQVMDSIPWVRCNSGNVFSSHALLAQSTEGKCENVIIFGFFSSEKGLLPYDPLWASVKMQLVAFGAI